MAIQRTSLGVAAIAAAVLAVSGASWLARAGKESTPTESLTAPVARREKERAMDPDRMIEETFSLLFKRQGLDGKLSKEEMVALLGICHREFAAEFEPATRFLDGSPDRQTVQSLYKSERAKDAHEIASRVDSSSSTMDVGDLRVVRFTAAMWEVAKGCRVAGYVAKLDALANYYSSRWGNPADGSFAIDGDANRSGSR
jgi:hypothetical protein